MLDRALVLSYHFQDHFDPPLSDKLIPLAEEAIDAMESGRPDQMIRGQQAYQIVEDLALDRFIQKPEPEVDDAGS